MNTDHQADRLQALRVGGPALFVDEFGKRHRVFVTSDGRSSRTCVFLDELGTPSRIVAARLLEPCDENHQPLSETPFHLASNRNAGAPRVAEDYKPMHKPRSSVLEKFDRGLIAEPEGVILAAVGLDQSLSDRIENAEADAISTDRHKRADARRKLIAVQQDVHRNRATDEVDAGRNETIRLERRRQEHARAVEIAAFRKHAASLRPPFPPEVLEQLVAQHTLKLIERDLAAMDFDATTGAARIKTRDGLRTLVESGALSRELGAAGYWFREIYEATERSLGSAMREGGGGTGDASVALERRAELLVVRKRVEAAVQANARNGRGLTALRLIAGQGRTINDISRPKHGSDRALNGKALLDALAVVAEFRGKL